MSYKYIDGYENYIIYEDGKIYNQNTKKFLKGYSRVDGYINTCLHKDGKPKFMSLHRLIALSFIPNPHNKPFIDHINRIRDDNRIENGLHLNKIIKIELIIRMNYIYVKELIKRVSKDLIGDSN